MPAQLLRAQAVAQDPVFPARVPVLAPIVDKAPQSVLVAHAAQATAGSELHDGAHVSAVAMQAHRGAIVE